MVQRKISPVTLGSRRVIDSNEDDHEGETVVRRVSGLSVQESDGVCKRMTKLNNRIVHIDPGLLSPEELLQQNHGRRLTLEKMVLENESEVQNQPNKLNLLKKKGKYLLDDARLKISYDDFMLATTVFILFSDDLRLLYFPSSADVTFEVMSTIAFVLFLAEIILYSWVKSDFSEGFWKVKGYMFSFFFWLDLMALCSLISDLAWFASMLRLPDLSSDPVNRGNMSNVFHMKFGRVFRMTRLVRLVKLYKISSKRKRDRQIFQDLQWLFDSGDNEINREELEERLRHDEEKQSKVGVKLSDIITRRVIIAVLLMLCVVPLLTYQASQDDELDSLEFLQSINIDAGFGSSVDCNFLVGSFLSFKNFMSSVRGSFLVGVSVSPSRCDSDILIDFSESSVVSSVREEFIQTYSSQEFFEDGIKYQVNATYDMTSFVHAGCKERIYLIVLVIVMLVILSKQFSADAEKLVLEPIDNMMEMVNLVAHEPLEDFDFDSLSSGNQYETKQVQVAIQKITELLRVGFGIAGAEIISMNMAVEGGTSAVLDPMIPGKRIYAIFGFCDIHDFDLCTEKLEDEIMTFVNQIAKIVHDEVSRWGGRCNKNLGNAFLMVWRLGDELLLRKMNGPVRRRSLKKSITSESINKPESVDLRMLPGINLTTDKALIGFLKVIVAINRDSQILHYRRDNRLTKGNEPFKLRMGFGLHAGWAIEGAVGSLQKVDATYLSPHVNMAARMEAASRQFGVALLLTHSVYDLLSKEAQDYCRKVDVVTVKGSAIPMTIYTTDTFQNQHFPVLKTPKYTCLDLDQVLRVHASSYTPIIWQQDPDLLQLRRLCSPIFLKTFNKGIDEYLNGDWPTARRMLEEADDLMIEAGADGGDGPSRTLLKYMKNKNWICPDDWLGFRPLTSK